MIRFYIILLCIFPKSKRLWFRLLKILINYYDLNKSINKKHCNYNYLKVHRIKDYCTLSLRNYYYDAILFTICKEHYNYLYKTINLHNYD